jgi:indolepyruvate ferredoxin oxidoreductase alpha subunit
MDELGVHVEACSNEASAAAMLGASIHYPLRGAVTWKSIVGTNVAADALSNLSSPGVTGGVLVVVGEDYGEGASVIQERTHAYALKSSMCLLDPRPDLGVMVRMVEEGFRLSETSNMPCLMELRIRTCHVRGSFECKDNVAPAVSTRALMTEPAGFDYMRLAHPPVTFRHEKLKGDERIPAARRYIVEHALNELIPGQRHADLGIVVQGGLYNALVRSLQQQGLADAFGETDIPILVLNVTYPLVPEQVADFCVGKRAVLVVEEGQPEYIEQDIATCCAGATSRRRCTARTCCPAGEYGVEVLSGGIAPSPRSTSRPAQPVVRTGLARGQPRTPRGGGAPAHAPLPNRPPSFCIGCPERPVFSALKLAQQETGPVHIAADIGCHAFGTFEPFSMGHSILGYGMSLASRAGVAPMMNRRTLSIMGDGGFWHNGLLTGVQSALFNDDDAVLLIFKNGYTSATGTQDIISTPDDDVKERAVDKQQSLVDKNQTIEATLTGLGVKWMRTVTTYDVERMRKTLTEALTSDFNGLKVVIAEGECQLERQRRIKPWIASLLKKGEARGAREVRRGRRRVQRRPRLHPPVGLPHAHAQGQPRSAEGRPGCHRDRRLRGLRPVRRERARGHAVPELLSRRGGAEPEVARTPRALAARRGRARTATRMSHAMERTAPSPSSSAPSAAKAAACSPNGWSTSPATPAMPRRAPRSPASRSAPAPPPTTSRCSPCRSRNWAAGARCSA